MATNVTDSTLKLDKNLRYTGYIDNEGKATQVQLNEQGQIPVDANLILSGDISVNAFQTPTGDGIDAVVSEDGADTTVLTNYLGIAGLDRVNNKIRAFSVDENGILQVEGNILITNPSIDVNITNESIDVHQTNAYVESGDYLNVKQSGAVEVEGYDSDTDSIKISNLTHTKQTTIVSPVELTASWNTIGTEIDVDGAKTMGIYITLDINDSQDVRLRVVANGDGTSEPFVFPIKTVSSTNVKVDAEYFEFNTDADQSMLIPIDLGGIVDGIRIQVMAGTVGASAGQIVTLNYKLGY